MQQTRAENSHRKPVNLLTGEDREQIKRRDALRAEQEARDEYNAEQMADRYGLSSARGRMFRRTRPPNAMGGLFAVDHFSRAAGLTNPLTIMAVMDGLERVAQTAQSLVTQFVKPAIANMHGQLHANGVYEDDSHIYETVAVSRATQKVLAAELAMVRLHARELHEAPKDSQAYQDKATDLEDLMDRCRIRIHPLSGRYVHCITRVMDEEAHYNAQRLLPSDGLAHVFYAKASGHDSLRVGRDIADQFDDQPQEAVDTSAEAKAPPPRPLLPDGLHYR